MNDLKKWISIRRFVFSMSLGIALMLTGFGPESANGEIVTFRLTGNGGAGLLGSNVTPGSGSVGQGGIGFTGITFNTDTNILHVDVQWGIANGYSGDLTGPITMLHLHGPTDEPPPNSFSQTGPLMVSLSNSLNFDDSPTSGGVVDDFFINGGSDEQGLLQGRTYINVHTDMFPMGEIRGYLVAVPEPGTLWMAGLISLALIARRQRPM